MANLCSLGFPLWGATWRVNVAFGLGAKEGGFGNLETGLGNFRFNVRGAQSIDKNLGLVAYENAYALRNCVEFGVVSGYRNGVVVWASLPLHRKLR